MSIYLYHIFISIRHVTSDV